MVAAMRQEDQARILTEVQSRILQSVCAGADKGGPQLDEVLADSIFHEKRRLKEQKDSGKPFMLMCQHKAPHRTWMPALRHLTLYDDITIPEPPTLFDTKRIIVNC